MTILFADISEYQNVTSWAAYGNAHQIVGIKLTEGTVHVDPKGKVRGHESKHHVKCRLFYHFARFCAFGASARKEADYFLAALDAAGGLGPHDCVVVDMEWRQTGYPTKLARRKYRAFCNRVLAKTGLHRMITYSGKWWWDPAMGSAPVEEAGWISAYVPLDQFEQYVPATFKGHVVAHQYAGGNLGPGPHDFPGISSPIDGNRVMHGLSVDDFIKHVRGEVHEHQYPGHALKKGSAGPNVRLVQRRLRVYPDGTFGNKTKAAVIRFQHNHDIKPAKGTVGPHTWRAMFD